MNFACVVRQRYSSIETTVKQGEVCIKGDWAQWALTKTSSPYSCTVIQQKSVFYHNQSLSECVLMRNCWHVKNPDLVFIRHCKTIQPYHFAILKFTPRRLCQLDPTQRDLDPPIRLFESGQKLSLAVEAMACFESFKSNLHHSNAPRLGGVHPH